MTRPGSRILASNASIRSTARLEELRAIFADVVDDFDALLAKAEGARTQAEEDQLRGKIKALAWI